MSPPPSPAQHGDADIKESPVKLNIKPTVCVNFSGIVAGPLLEVLVTINLKHKLALINLKHKLALLVRAIA